MKVYRLAGTFLGDQITVLHTVLRILLGSPIKKTAGPSSALSAKFTDKHKLQSTQSMRRCMCASVTRG